jgi:inner membrane protein
MENNPNANSGNIYQNPNPANYPPQMPQGPSFFEKNRIIIKGIVIFFLTLLLLIPSSMVTSIIYERQSRQGEAFDEVSSKWGYPQTIIGPVLNIPYYEIYIDSNKVVNRYQKTIHILPNALKINGELFPEKRHRGIYDIILYKIKVNLGGNFEIKQYIDDLNIDKKDILFEKSYLSIGISDNRGIEKTPVMIFNGKSLNFNAGIPDNDIFAQGIFTNLPLTDSMQNMGAINFDLNMDLRGSKELYFHPIGKTTETKITSTWANPSFIGKYLPNNPAEISTNGFSAQWNILHVNRNYPQAWLNNSYNTNESDFGLSLMNPVDNYAQSDRSVKYAILFIALTFLIFFFVEMINKISIHPMQYVLIGIALVIFYILLISISEQLSFKWAYLIAAFMTIGLITIYAHSIIKSRPMTLLTCGVLSILYLFIYIIIQLQDYALLMGSIGLFIILALVMFFSRKIDYYKLDVKKD